MTLRIQINGFPKKIRSTAETLKHITSKIKKPRQNSQHLPMFPESRNQPCTPANVIRNMSQTTFTLEHRTSHPS